MYKVVYRKQTLKDIPKLKSSGLDVKVKSLIEIIKNDPFQTPPTYEKLIDLCKDDKDVVYELVKRTEKLSEYDRNQILGYEDLLKAKAQIDSSDRAIWITAIVVILVVICLSALVLRVRKKRRIKRMNEMTEENEDW